MLTRQYEEHKSVFYEHSRTEHTAGAGAETGIVGLARTLAGGVPDEGY